jgi:hypothetical protein
MAPTPVKSVEWKEEATTSRVAMRKRSIVTVTNQLPGHRVGRGTMDNLRSIIVFAGAREI